MPDTDDRAPDAGDEVAISECWNGDGTVTYRVGDEEWTVRAGADGSEGE